MAENDNYDGIPMRLLVDSICHSLEDSKRGSRYPVLQEYGTKGTDDLEQEKIEPLKRELSQVQQQFGELELGVLEGEEFRHVDTVKVIVPVHSTGYSNLIGPKVKKDAREEMKGYVEMGIEMCDEAIRRRCGFGKYSREGGN
ncbi:hypothetical protein J4442_04430 [Candidatus Woesearchaeota archaeon]|nr:hypothetical protein [Candidatus Woesearchaeota archaeon]